MSLPSPTTVEKPTPPFDYAAAYLAHVCGQARRVRQETAIEPAEPLPADVTVAKELLRTDELEAAKPYRVGTEHLLRQLTSQPDILGEIQALRERKPTWWERLRLALGMD